MRTRKGCFLVLSTVVLLAVSACSSGGPGDGANYDGQDGGGSSSGVSGGSSGAGGSSSSGVSGSSGAGGSSGLSA
jgi:hypothetical protein